MCQNILSNQAAIKPFFVPHLLLQGPAIAGCFVSGVRPITHTWLRRCKKSRSPLCASLDLTNGRNFPSLSGIYMNRSESEAFALAFLASRGISMSVRSAPHNKSEICFYAPIQSSRPMQMAPSLLSWYSSVQNKIIHYSKIFIISDDCLRYGGNKIYKQAVLSETHQSTVSWP